MGQDVTALVKDLFNRAHFDDHLADTNIVLIPKKTTPLTMADLRPISLCNVLYKIASKVLSNRLKWVLDQVISPTQSAFIQGHLITDNIMIAYEVMHYMK